MYALLPSTWAPSAPGPNTRTPRVRSRSARPSTKGCSGPMTTRSTEPSATNSSTAVATEPGMPGLPGVTTTSAVRDSTAVSACSRPPEPTTTTFTRFPSAAPVDELLAARPDAHQRHGHTHLLL